MGQLIKDLARQGKDIAITGQRSESDRFASGGVVRVNKPTWQVGANKTKEDHTEKFKPKTYDNPYRSSLQDKAQKAAGQQAARGSRCCFCTGEETVRVGESNVYGESRNILTEVPR